MQQYYVDLLVDALLDEGFTVSEASRLIELQEKYQQWQAAQESEYQRNRLSFVRWLVHTGRLTEFY